MQGSREVQAHAVALRVDETVYTLPAHTAIVENGRHAAEVERAVGRICRIGGAFRP